MNNIKIKKQVMQRGSTLFFAIIVTTLILTIGLAIAQIIVAELRMGADFATSKAAYYAAEKGLEAAKLRVKEEPGFTGQDCYPSTPPYEYCYEVASSEGERIITVRGISSNIQREIKISQNIGTSKGLVALWHFDEGLGMTVADSSGNGNDGYLFTTRGVNNILLNPSFESYDISYRPLNWSAFGTGGSYSSVSLPAPPNGTYSLRVAFEDDVGAYYGVRQSVSVTPGMQYRLSGWLRRNAASGLWQCDVYGTGIDSPGINLTSDASWTYKTETVTIPSGTSSVYIRCFFNGVLPEEGQGGADALEFVPLSAPPTWVEGKIGGALNFDGIDDLVKIPESSSLDINSEITIKAWIKPTSTQPNGAPTLISRHLGTTPGAQYQLGLSSFETTHKMRFCAEPNFGCIVGNNALTNNEWNHLVVTFNGAEVKYYLNGVPDKTTPLATPLTSYSADIGIGATPYSMWFFSGIIDEAAIYNRALSAEEVLNLYVSGL